ncbi:MAG: T9SS type A sorting domain-containing protein [Flavobacteriaceae bacterium]|nr:T9SS type A sorting domain-containing protein [Flavobacteriaceae bacterium]
MKKIYILAVALVAFAFTGTSQLIDDDMDFYDNAIDISSQSPTFDNWSGASGTTEDAFTTDVIAIGTKSLLIGNNTTSDVLLLTGNLNGGQYTFSFDYYVTDGATGFYGLMETDDSSNPAFSVTFYPNQGGAGVDEIRVGGGVAGTYDMPKDTWVKMTHLIDLDADNITVLMDGVEIYNAAYGSTLFGAVDLWSVDGSCENYFDNFFLDEGILATESFDTKGFVTSMRNGQLTLQANEVIDNVAIYNMLGQEVYNSKLGATSSTINMSSFANGTYIVRASINGTVGSIKVIK